MSSRSIAMPPRMVNSGIGGRISARSGPRRAAVEGLGLERAAAGGRALELVEVVGVERAGAELHLGPVEERVDRLGSGVEKGLAQRLGRAIPDGAVEKPADLLPAVVGADRGGEPGAGHPGRRSGERRGAAEVLGALDEEHALPVERGEDRRRHSAGSGAEHRDVERRPVRGLGQPACGCGHRSLPRDSIRRPDVCHSFEDSSISELYSKSDLRVLLRTRTIRIGGRE